MWITPKSADGLETFSRLISMLEYNLRGMKPVGSKDIYEAKALSLISSGDLDIVIALYLPIIGSFAFAIFVALVNQSRQQQPSTHLHGPLFARLQLTSGQFAKGVEALEAVGLIKTYYRKEEQAQHFIYGLYAPKDPASFFQDPLLLGTLRKYLGEEEVLAIHQKYKVASQFEGFEDVSSGFSEFFHPDFADPIYSESSLKALAHAPGKIRTAFDYAEFRTTLNDLGYESVELSKKDIQLIERYASLYGIAGEQMGIIVSKCLNLYGNKNERIDYAKLESCCIMNLKYMPAASNKGKPSEVTSDSLIASKIKMMDETPPMQFLTYLQGNRKPAKSDIKLLNVLALEMGLPDPAINALVDYVLQTNHNVLSSAYCEKLAAFLVREGVMTSRDAMDKLTKSRNKPKKANVVKHEQETPIPATETENEEQLEDVSSFLKELYGE